MQHGQRFSPKPQAALLLAAGADVNGRITRTPPRYGIGLTGPAPAGATPFFLAAAGADIDAMRLLVADCSVEYDGRLGARLPRARRLIVLKADGSIAVRWRQGGKHTETLALSGFDSVPATGRMVTIPEHDFFYKVADDLIVEIRPDSVPGGAPGNWFARWDGSSWSALGSGLNNGVRGLTVYDDGTGPALFAGGDFTSAGGTSANRIAKWNGGAWSALGSGLDSVVRALTVYDDGTGPALFAGGGFTSAGGTSANRIAKWNGSVWSASFWRSTAVGAAAGTPPPPGTDSVWWTSAAK